MPRVSIGSGAIIASKAVVVDDVPAYSIVGGNPAKVIKSRFDDRTLNALLDIAWWDWNADKITRNLGMIVDCDLAALKRASKLI